MPSCPKLKPKARIEYKAIKVDPPKLWIPIASDLEALKTQPILQYPRNLCSYLNLKVSSACIAANALAKIEPKLEWNDEALQKVLIAADDICAFYMKEMRQMRKLFIPIECICTDFFVGYKKANVLIQLAATGHSLDEGGFDAEKILNILAQNDGAILQDGGRTFAFWKQEDVTYSFTLDLTSNGLLVPFLGRSNDINSILKYIAKIICGCYKIFCFKLVSWSTATRRLSRLMLPQFNPNRKKSCKELRKEANVDLPPEGNEDEGGKEEDKVDEKQKLIDVLTAVTQYQDIIQQTTSQYTSDYKDIEEGVSGILQASEFATDPDTILHFNLAVAILQYHFPAKLWTKAILDKTMDMGKVIFQLSKELITEEDWTKRVQLPVKFGRKLFHIKFEKKIFGIVSPTNPESVSITLGITKYFESYDRGLIVGPQMVLIWQEKGRYFMFDVKERNQKGKKWTHFNSVGGDCATSCGNACVTWYNSPELLANCYESNIAIKYRSDSFRIVHLVITETDCEFDSFEFWKAISPIKWVLVGTRSICDYEKFSPNSRTDIAVHTGIAAIAKSMRKPESEWSPDDVNEIFVNGTELCDQVQPAFKTEEEVANTFNVKKIYTLENQCIEAIVEEGRVTGQVSVENPKKGGIPLRKGIPYFFKTRQYAILFHKEAAIAIWRSEEDGHYYFFYPYETRLKPHECPDCTKVLKLGYGYAMRVKNVHEIAKHLLLSMSIRPADEYSLNAVSVRLSELSTLRHYRAFSEYGAILLPFEDLHEGHEMYCSRANRQTIANVLVCLSLNHMKNSKNWTSEDATDILSMGDVIFCEILTQQPECKAKDYELHWEDVKPVIGLSSFTFERTQVEGVITPPDPDSLFDYGEEGFDEDVAGEYEEYELMGRRGGGFQGVTLRSALAKWENEENLFLEAVLDTDLYRVAIWKNDNLFFVFDPKFPTGHEEYMMDLIGEEEGGEGEGEVGSLFPKVNGSYVACFTSFETFYGHFIEKLSPDERQGKFILHEIVLTLEPVPMIAPDKEVTEFRKLTEELAILRGNLTQTDMTFRSLESQTISNCLIALGFAMFMPHDQITMKLLDLIMKYGYRYNSKRYKALKIPLKLDCTNEPSGQDAPKNISIAEFSPNFILFNLKFNWKVEAEGTDIFQRTEIRAALTKVGQIAKNGSLLLLEHKNYMNAVWKRDKYTYLFEPNETNPQGMLVPKGVPCVIRAKKIDALVDHLIDKYFPIDGESEFHWYQIKMVYQAVPAMGAEPLTELSQIIQISKLPEHQNMFKRISEHVRIMHHSGSSEECPLNLLCLAALVYGQIICVEFWNLHVFDKIKALGTNVAKHSNYDMSKYPKSLKIPLTEVNLNLTVNKTLCTVALQKNTQGPIICSNKMEGTALSLKNSLLSFISDCNLFIITISNIAFGLWKENNHFYAFGVIRENPREMYVLASDDITSLYDEMFRRIYHAKDERNWYELQNVEVKVSCVTGTIYEKCWTPVQSESCKRPKRGWYTCNDLKPKDGCEQKRPKSTEIDGIEFLYAKNCPNAKKNFSEEDYTMSLQGACVAAAVMSRLRNPLTWNKEILESCMLTGTNLYINARAVAGQHFRITDLNGVVHMFNLRLNIHITEPVKKSGEDDVCCYLIEVLRKHQCVYVLAECFSFVIIRGLQFSFLYNPGTLQPFCDELPTDTAFLIKCGSITDLIRKLLRNCTFMDCDCIRIGAIRVE